MNYKARLCGIKPLDCNAANKFVKVWNALNNIEKDFNGKGKYPYIRNMSPTCNELFTDEWAESLYLVSFVDETNAIHNYLCFHNSYDCYRSNADVIKMPNTDRSLCTNLEHLHLNILVLTLLPINYGLYIFRNLSQIFSILKNTQVFLNICQYTRCLYEAS